MATDADALKHAAGVAALSLVGDGMIVGLGSGSTLAHVIKELGERVRAGDLHITAVPTSWQARRLAREYGIPLVDPADLDAIDIALDGADEIDPAGNLIKGAGAAQTTEKIVAALARKFHVIADESKQVAHLGARHPITIEVVAPAVGLILRELSAMGARSELREGKGKVGPIITDLGNPVIDAHFGAINDPVELDRRLNQLPGMVGHGLFVAAADGAVIARAAPSAGSEPVIEYLTF